MTEISDSIKVGLHGHGLPDHSRRWKSILGFDESAEDADIFYNACSRAGIGIYVITDDEYGHIDSPHNPLGLSRHEQVGISASRSSLNYEKLGENAFVLEKDGNPIIFLDGQSIDVIDRSRESGRIRRYELLTFGRSGIKGGWDFEQTFSYLSNEGLPAIGEHLLAYGHHGPIERDRLEEYCQEKRFNAVEHNAKMAFPKLVVGWIPSVHEKLKVLKGANRATNKDLEEIAFKHRTPMIANDDSDFPSHIGAAYTIFSRSAIRMNSSGDEIVEDILRLIKTGRFETHKGHLTVPQVLNYTWKIATN
jgi:hypothetical protein